MEHRKPGRTGLRVSPADLGTMIRDRDTDELEVKKQLDIFLDAGGMPVDTAVSCGEGASEEVIGTLLREYAGRQDLVLVSKAGVRTWRTGERSSVADTSRGLLLDTLDASLARLSTDHLSLPLVQMPDSNTSLEETTHALSLVASSGRIRYVDIASHPTWALVRTHDLFSGYGCGSGLATVEVGHSLLSQDIERELWPASQALGFGILGYAPLGRGVLTGKYRATIPPGSWTASPHLHSHVSPYLGEAHRGAVEAVAIAASGLDRKPAEVALTWARNAPGIASAIAGVRIPTQSQGVLLTDDLELPVQIQHTLDEVTSVQPGYSKHF